MKSRVTALILALALAVSACAWAVPPDGGHPLSLVANASVQKELGLTPGQVEAVKPLLGTATDAAKTQTAMRTLAKTLDKGQLARLAEIGYQASGAAALAEPAAAARAGLNQAQTRKVADIARNRELDLKMVLRVTRFRSAEAMRKFIFDWRQGTEKAILAELTAAQQKAFETMQGKKFDTAGILK